VPDSYIKFNSSILRTTWLIVDFRYLMSASRFGCKYLLRSELAASISRCEGTNHSNVIAFRSPGLAHSYTSLDQCGSVCVIRVLTKTRELR